MTYDVVRGCLSKKRYMSSGLAAVAAQEFMTIQQGVTKMVAYRCPHCNDWHISKNVRQDSDDRHLIIDQDLTIKFRQQIETDRMKRKLRVKLERHEQARRAYLGERNEETVSESSRPYGYLRLRARKQAPLLHNDERSGRQDSNN